MHPANDGVEITPVMTGKICNLGPWVLKQTPAQPSLLTTPRHAGHLPGHLPDHQSQSQGPKGR